MSNTAEIHATRSFGYERFLWTRIPWAIGAIALSLFILAVANSGSATDSKARFAAAILLVLSIIFIGYAAHRRLNPAKPALQLSPSGVLYRRTRNHEVLIPWREIEGVASIDITTCWTNGLPITYRDVTAITVSEAFYRRHLDPGSIWKRGPYWDLHFIPLGTRMQVALHHEIFMIPAAEMRDAVESRWRAFSGRPEAKLPPIPFKPHPRPFWYLSPRTKTVVAAVLFLAALPAVYYWHWLWTWQSFPDFNEAGREYYFRDAMNPTGIPARRPDGSMVRLLGWNVRSISFTRCIREITRDPSAAQSLFPRYNVAATCTADIIETAGTPATAIYRLMVQRYEWNDWQGKPQPASAIMPARLDLAEADRFLCSLGNCAPGVSPPPAK